MWKILLLLLATTLRPVLLKLKSPDGGVFMSSSDLIGVFKLEQNLVQVLKGHKEQLESSLKSIKNYVGDVQQLYSSENCWPVETCSETEIYDKIVANPIYNYQLLKRLVASWKHMEDSVKELDPKKTLSELKKVKHKYGGMPNERDLQGAAKALNRLQSTYKLNVTEFSRGNILGFQTAAELTVKDTFYLGRYAYMSNNYEVALKWLEEAALQVAAEGSSEEPHVVKGTHVEQVMRQVHRKLPKDKPIVRNRTYKLGVVPPKTQNRAEMTNQNDRDNYEALCRGMDLLPKYESKTLFCHYDTRNDPYFILQPLKVEVNHEDPHKIVTIYNVLSDKEADRLVQLGKPKMATASIGHGKEISDMRVSRNSWLEDNEDPVVDKVSLRINRITGLQTVRKFDQWKEGKREEYEFLQIANYGIGGHYDVHQDPMFVYKEPEYLVHSIENKGKEIPYITGDRLATFMMYLSEVPLGGRTAFPRLGVAVRPVKGSAVFWYNLRRSGRSDMTMLHGGCPVILGSKWVANKWVREAANIFHHKCIGNIDN